MRISDWSSDVCSSDLVVVSASIDRTELEKRRGRRLPVSGCQQPGCPFDRRCHLCQPTDAGICVAKGDRKSVVQGKRVSVGVDLGGSRIITNKKTETSDYIQ